MSPTADDPLHDPERLAAVRAAELLDTPPEEVFDQLTRLAARLLDAPMAMVSVLDDQRHFGKSTVGLDALLPADRNLPVGVSFCRHALASPEPMVVPDAREHPALRDNPAVREHGVVAYLGVPLVVPAGQALGTLCVIDSQPRAWDAQEVETLRSLAATVLSTIALRTEARRAARAAGEPSGATPPDDDRLRRVAIAHVEALERYDDAVRGAAASPAQLERERDARQRVAETLAALEAALPAADPVPGAGDAAGMRQTLVEAAHAYVAAERAREAASLAFVAQRTSLEDYQIACAAVRAPELALRQALIGA